MQPLTRAELRGVLDVASGLVAATDLTQLADRLVEGVRALVPCEAVSYHEIDLLRRASTMIVDPLEVLEQTPSAAELLAVHAREHPIIVHQTATGDGAAVRVSDFLSVREFRDTGLYQELFRPLRTTDVLAVGLELSRQHVVAVALVRSGRTFSDRERDVVEALRPHAVAAFRLQQLQRRLTDLVALLDAARLAVPVGVPEPRRELLPVAVDPALTARERQVLRLVADGSTNAEVAAQLVVSPHTVKKHLEHIYDKLGVRGRTAAARAVPGGVAARSVASR